MSGSELYFERAAPFYAGRSAKGLWHFLRERESQVVLGLLSPIPGERILDAACGAGYYAKLLLGCGCDVEAVDRSPAMIAAASAAGVRAKVSSIESASFDKTFDGAVMAGAMEFNANLMPLFSSLAGSLQTGGRLVVIYPAGPLRLLYALYHRMHGIKIYLHHAEEIASKAESAGLSLIGQQNAGPLARAALFVKESPQ